MRKVLSGLGLGQPATRSRTASVAIATRAHGIKANSEARAPTAEVDVFEFHPGPFPRVLPGAAVLSNLRKPAPDWREFGKETAAALQVHRTGACMN